jgi:nucleoside-diphosphate-sugar epimerase
MKIAIIGCGYVGSVVACLWHQQGHDLTVTTTTPEKVARLEEVADRVIVLKGDNLDGLKEIISDREVVLLSIGATTRNVEGYREVYLETAKNLVTALRDCHSVKQLIYTGTYAVLGNRNGEWIDERSNVSPANEMGEILARTEEVLLSAASNNLRVCILRLAGIYGPKRELIKIFRSWAGTTRPGNGEEYSNWIHLDDIVGALELIRLKQLAGIYHLANDTPLKKRELLDTLFDRHGLTRINWDNSTPPALAYNLRLSNENIKSEGLRLIHPETFSVDC